MAQTKFEELPEEIKNQLDSLIPGTGLPPGSETREKLASVWLSKFAMFSGQISNLGMEIITDMAADDPRGAVMLTYSGSLISIGTLTGKSRWLEYASIKFRTDVPDLVHGATITLEAPLKQDAAAMFSGCGLKKSSSLFRIAVCPEGTGIDDQERRIREAAIFLTNGFVKLNRTLTLDAKGEVDQFTLKSIVSYVAKKNSITQVLARSVIDDYLAMMETGILLGERVTFGKIGNANLRYQAARKARVLKNPQTGEDLLVASKPECLAPKFSFSSGFKEKSGRVNPDILTDTSETGEDD